MSAAAGHMRANAELSKRQDEMVQMCINFLGDPLHVESGTNLASERHLRAQGIAKMHKSKNVYMHVIRASRIGHASTASAGEC